MYLYHSTGCRISSFAITTSVESPADGCAISSDNADNNIISNCIIDGNYNGIYMDWSSGENLIDGNFISNCSGAGIYVGRGQSSDGGHNRITNNHISECGCAIYIYYSYYNIVSGNVIDNESMQNYGIYIYYSDYNVIANNFVYDGSGEIDGINSRGAKNSIVGNTILNGYYGIYIYDNQSLVSGNVVYGMSMNAIRLSTSCEDTLVIGNHTLNSSVVDGGSNNTVVNNLT